MKILKTWGLIRTVSMQFNNGTEALYPLLTGLKNSKRFDKFSHEQRQIHQLLKRLEKKNGIITMKKTPDIFSAFSGRGEIQIKDSKIKSNEIEIEFKSRYEELWIVLATFIIMSVFYSVFVYLELFKFYWIFVLFGGLVIFLIIKIFMLRRDVNKLEAEFNLLLKYITAYENSSNQHYLDDQKINH